LEVRSGLQELYMSLRWGKSCQATHETRIITLEDCVSLPFLSASDLMLEAVTLAVYAVVRPPPDLARLLRILVRATRSVDEE
jgi:hypothetical protein